ncbi:YveK family protein [Geodermatophilus arenarius]|uniref:YveK family protein n=1 Tax=Geodermatophilus arenarius TaxID=1137990 RepID=A0ABV9LHB3_9ACTN
MELRDYGTALRRYWATWAAIALTGLFVALVVVLAVRPTYTTTAQVFVASSGDGTSGSQFVSQRVTTYPDVARSQTVLGPVIDELSLDESVTDLRARVAAVNPPDTSQVDVSVTDEDPARAAAVANAVAERFSTAVEDLEERQDGVSPVDLTVTDPATVPSSPVFPVPGLVLGLGLFVGLTLGAAVAVLRSRADTRLHTVDDVRTAWGAGGDELTVHAVAARRSRRRRGTGRPVAMLARQLEPVDDDGSVRAVVLAASPDESQAAHDLVTALATELVDGGTPVVVAEPGEDAAAPVLPAGARLTVASASAPAREWRRLARENDGAVLVVTAGRTEAADLREARSLLAAVGAGLFSVVLLPSRRTGRAASGDTTPARPAVPAADERVPAGP